MTTENENSENITELRTHLFATIRGLRDKNAPLDIERAKAISEVAKTIIASAKVEVDYLKLAGGGESSFIDGAVGNDSLPAGIVGRTVHRLK
jgi:hypothetical protein